VGARVRFLRGWFEERVSEMHQVEFKFIPGDRVRRSGKPYSSVFRVTASSIDCDGKYYVAFEVPSGRVDIFHEKEIEPAPSDDPKPE
jgi:hypothetical protein